MIILVSSMPRMPNLRLILKRLTLHVSLLLFLRLLCIYIYILTTIGQLKSTNKLIEINITRHKSNKKSNNLESILQVSLGHLDF
jgi:hypothetical protein